MYAPFFFTGFSLLTWFLFFSYSTRLISSFKNYLHTGRRQCVDGYKAHSFTNAYDSIAALTTRLAGPDDTRLRVMKGVGAGVRERVRRRMAGQSVAEILQAKFDEEALLAEEKKIRRQKRKGLALSGDKELVNEIKTVPGLGCVLSRARLWFILICL